MTIQEQLFALQDKEYAVFQSKLTPNVSPELFIGVRVPDARKLAKKIAKEQDYSAFLATLPHKYFDENMLHGLLISELKDYDLCIEKLDLFLPYVDNWAVCDIMSPKILGKHKAQLIEKIREWSSSEDVYTRRFGIEMLMTYFLDGDFLPEYLDIVSIIRSDEYYVNMMIAWFFATALAKQWDNTIKVLEENRLDIWTHNKTIQKARESYRITAEQKEYLKSIKRA